MSQVWHVLHLPVSQQLVIRVGYFFNFFLEQIVIVYRLCESVVGLHEFLIPYIDLLLVLLDLLQVLDFSILQFLL